MVQHRGFEGSGNINPKVVALMNVLIKCIIVTENGGSHKWLEGLVVNLATNACDLFLLKRKLRFAVDTSVSL